MAKRILVVDDDLAFQGMLTDALTERGFEVATADSAEAGIEAAAKGAFDLILHDIKLPGMSGLDALEKLKEADPGVDVIMMTAFSSKDSGVEALRRGAYDYFTKPFSLGEMEVVIRRALEKRRLQAEVQGLKRSLKKGGPLEGIIGESPSMQRVKTLLERVGPLETDVLVIGETGTGKELVSDVVHALSPRAGGPFVKLNCAAIPENLLESELFGHEKGAFTGATAVKRGKFEQADGGSILLDEIGDMPLHLQPKLLRAVEQKQVERLGGARPVSFDVRIIAATNQDLADMMTEGRFRGDLYYRLNVASIHLPPLRERKEDVPLLAEHFLKRVVNPKLGTDLTGLSQEAMRMALDYHWPGNVRQFANALERAAIFTDGSQVSAGDMEMALQRGPGGAAPAAPAPNAGSGEDMDDGLPLKQAVNAFERRRIEAALGAVGGVQTEAAKRLGISPKNLWNKLRKHDIDPGRWSA